MNDQPQQPGWGQQPGQPPYGYAPPPPKKSSAGKVIAIIVGSIVGFFVLVGGCAAMVADSGSSTDTPTDSPPAAAAEEPNAEPADKEKAPAEPEPELKKEGPKGYSDGDYVVGEDIPPGTYETAGASSDIFDVCMISTEPTSDSEFPQLKSANQDERIIITLSEADGIVTISGCEPLTKR